MFAMSLSACFPGSAHQNFIDTMQLEVGKSTEDPYAFINHYSDLLVTIRKLPNGHLEQEIKISRRRGNCHVFFEIDEKQRKIVSWRYEGSEEYCAIVP